MAMEKVSDQVKCTWGRGINFNFQNALCFYALKGSMSLNKLVLLELKSDSPM